MKNSKIIQLVCLLLVVLGYGQNKLKGKVVDFNNKPIAKAKIYLDSTYSNVKTNKEGEFEVLLPENVKTINVVSKNHELSSSEYTKESTMNFKLKEAVKSKSHNKENHDVSAYSESNQKFILRDAQKNKSTENKYTYLTIYDMIRGKVAGVSVSNDNRITIRGNSSWKYVGQPLFVVNGMVVANIDYLLPINVKSITVLKDNEAAIYGNRAAQGVLVITTKN